MGCFLAVVAVAIASAVHAQDRSAAFPAKPIRIIVGYTDTMSGQVAMNFPSLAPTLPLVRAGRLRALGANVIGSSPAEFLDLWRKDQRRWIALLQGHGIKVQ